ncbi:MAG: inositol monophosphatase family protein, partial [Pontixanthobacter sp.]
MNDAQLAAHLADTAGRILLMLRGSAVFEGKALGAAGDATANQFIVHALRNLRPDDGILSEESTDTKDRLDRDRVWIIDPVDGTREYGEARADWAVHVGLAVEGAATVGAVALPGLEGGLVLRSDRPTARTTRNGSPRLVVSRTRP